MDEYLAERNAMQEELFKKVPMMAGAAHLVRSLVSPLFPSHTSTKANRAACAGRTNSSGYGIDISEFQMENGKLHSVHHVVHES